jgi:hypothetical protein
MSSRVAISRIRYWVSKIRWFPVWAVQADRHRKLVLSEGKLGIPAQGCQASGLGLLRLADTEFIYQCGAYRIAHRSSQVLFTDVGWRKSVEGNNPVKQFVAFERHDFLIETGKLLAATHFSF